MGGVLSRRSGLPLVMWIASAAFVLYGTTIPFSFVFDRQIALTRSREPEPSDLTRHGTPRLANNFISNMLLFTPFSAFSVWAVTASVRRSAHCRVTFGAALVCVEALQRSPSIAPVDGRRSPIVWEIPRQSQP